MGSHDKEPVGPYLLSDPGLVVSMPHPVSQENQWPSLEGWWLEVASNAQAGRCHCCYWWWYQWTNGRPAWLPDRAAAGVKRNATPGFLNHALFFVCYFVWWLQFLVTLLMHLTLDPSWVSLVKGKIKSSQSQCASRWVQSLNEVASTVLWQNIKTKKRSRTEAVSRSTRSSYPFYGKGTRWEVVQPASWGWG